MSFEQYSTQRLPSMLGTARAICADAALAEDLVQEVLIKLQRNWAMVSTLESPDAYVRRMLVNEYLSWRRKWARLVPVADSFRRLDDSDYPSDDFASRHADCDVLYREIRKLPPRQRAAIGLRYFGGLGDDEIARTMGCKESTVRVHIGRALRALRVTHPDSALVYATGSIDDSH